MAAGAGDVGVDGLLDGAVSVVEHDGGISWVKFGFEEGPGDVLEDDGGGGGGVIDDGYLVDVVGVDEGFEEGAGTEDVGFEVVEVEGVGLVKELELVFLLGGDDGRWAGSEAAVVDTGNGGVVVGEFGGDVGEG